MITILRWALLLGFIAQVVGIFYGVIVLARIKREQRQLIDVLSAFSERSADIAQALTNLKDKQTP